MEYRSVLSLAPLRVSFIGGGTDIPSFYRHHPGCVISTAINKYVYVHIKRHDPLFQERYRISYSEIEHTQNRNAIKNKIVKGCLEFLGIDEPLQISTSSDLPANSGLGSSSSLAVALLNGLHALRGKSVSKVQLAEEAAFVEIEALKSPIGKQDQFAAAFGGLNYFEFSTDDTVRIEPIYLPKLETDNFLRNSLMIWTGQQRSANAVLSDQESNKKENFPNLVELTKLTQCFRRELLSVESSKQILAEIMTQGWRIKQGFSDKINSPEVLEITNELDKDSNCFGYKLLGAGGGGFILAIFDGADKASKYKLFWPSISPLIDFSGARIASVN